MTTIALFNAASSSKSGVLLLDAILSEGHSLSNTVTKYPVETGATITDHILNAPRQLTLECLVTNSPLRARNKKPVDLGVNSDDFLKTSGKNPQAAAKPANNYAQQAFKALEAMHAARQPVTVVTRMKTYRNMAIDSLSIPRSAATGDALQFTLNLTEITQVPVKPARGQAEKTKSPGAKPHKDKGRQTASGTLAKTRQQLLAKIGRKRN
jgi:hypothetical protein